MPPRRKARRLRTLRQTTSCVNKDVNVMEVACSSTSDTTEVHSEESNADSPALAVVDESSDWPIYVSGRLGLAGIKKKYPVTRAEIRRRTGFPEFMSATAVCQYIKRSREKKSMPKDIIVPRKSRTRDSLFSLLTEEESESLARDFASILKEDGVIKNLVLHPIDGARTVRNAVEGMMDRLDQMEPSKDVGNLRSHGFVIPALRSVLDLMFEHIH